MKILVTKWLRFPFFIQLVWLLCVLGTLTNLWLVGRDLLSDGVLLRLHAGFLILYAAQVVFILVQEKYVCLLTFLQGIMALLTTADFTFAPLLQVVGHAYYWFCSPSVETLKVYQYVFVCAAFTLQMASAIYLWGYLVGKNCRPA